MSSEPVAEGRKTRTRRRQEDGFSGIFLDVALPIILISTIVAHSGQATQNKTLQINSQKDAGAQQSDLQKIEVTIYEDGYLLNNKPVSYDGLSLFLSGEGQNFTLLEIEDKTMNSNLRRLLIKASDTHEINLAM